MATLTGSTMTDELIGQTLGSFRVDALLGEGNMGAVYQAFDTNLTRKVVLKVMHRQLANHESFQLRFMQEAQAAARLDHPSIIKVYNFDTTPNLYMVMEYVSGPSLGEYVKHQQSKNEVVNLDTVLRLVAQVADGLDYAHGQGVVHRDIKPSNILLKPLTRPDREGDPALRAVVTDFGLAKLLEGGMHTLTGTFMGTLSYMSPEQCLGRDLDGRSDLYSLGIVLYQLATGQLPFNVKSPTDAIRMHVKELPPAPRLVRPGLPELVERVILQTIAKNPASRYQTGSQLAEALRRAAWAIVSPTETSSVLMDGGARGSSIIGGEAVDSPVLVDQLLIYHAGEAPRVMGMNQDEVTVGRGQENDVMLPDKGVSRLHVKIVKSEKGWTIIDNESTNGAFLEKIRIAPGSAEPWDANTELRVGPYSLQWQKASPIPAQPVAPLPEEVSDSLDRPQQTNMGEIEIVVDPAAGTVAPGDRMNVQIMLMNRGPIVDHVNVRVENLPDEWVTYSEQLVKLMPGSRGFVRATITPPMNSRARGGKHPFRVIATPMSNPEAVVTAECEISVETFASFRAELEPRYLAKPGRFNTHLWNEGNAVTSYVVQAQKNNPNLQFNPAKSEVRLSPGQEYALETRLDVLKRPMFGRVKREPYSIEVWSPNNKLETLHGEVEIRPVIPGWVFGSLILALLAIAIFMIVWFTVIQA